MAALVCCDGCSSNEAATRGTTKAADRSVAAVDPRHELNDVCPITGDVIEPKLVATHRGSKIAFCCEHCLREFREMDDAGKDAILAKTYPTERAKK